MNRRHFFLAQAGWPALLASGAPRATVRTEIKRLKLRHTWTTTMSSSDYRDTLYVAYTDDGITGHGEGAPIVRYRENAEGARQAVESVRDLLAAADPWQFSKVMQQVFGRVEGEWAVKPPSISR
jgi:L-alanine-DL-glutamate epimerase-like enolase superfamily enzyme